MIDKILELLVNILTAYNQYSLLNRENLAQPIKMQLSNQKKKKKKEALSKFFTAFLKARSNSTHFKKTDEVQRLYIFRITDCERRGQVSV